MQPRSSFPGTGQLRAWEALEKVFSVDDEAADSDEAFLEHAKLKAHEALKNVLLDGDAAADSDNTFLEQAKRGARRRSENALLDGHQAKREQIMLQSQGDTIQQVN